MSRALVSSKLTTENGDVVTHLNMPSTLMTALKVDICQDKSTMEFLVKLC